MPEQERDGCFKDLVQKIVFGKLVILARQHPPSDKAVPNGSGHIDLSAHNRGILFAAQVFPIQALL